MTSVGYLLLVFINKGASLVGAATRCRQRSVHRSDAEPCQVVPRAGIGGGVPQTLLAPGFEMADTVGVGPGHL